MEKIDLKKVQNSEEWYKFALFAMEANTPTRKEIDAYIHSMVEGGICTDVVACAENYRDGLIGLSLVQPQ
jgi:hypothetical protein